MSSSGAVTLQNQVMACNSSSDFVTYAIVLCAFANTSHLFGIVWQPDQTRDNPSSIAVGMIVAVSSSLISHGLHCSSG